MEIKKNIVIFQAPWASLMDCGLITKLHGYDKEPCKSVPAQYYMPVYRGMVHLDVTEAQSEDMVNSMLEAVSGMFDKSNCPNPLLSRALSIGDVVELDGKHYIVLPGGFTEVEFKMPVEGDATLAPPTDPKSVADYLKRKYVINGKAAILLDHILEYNEMQGWDEEDQQAFLELMFSGLGITGEDRDLLVVEDEYE